MNYEQLVKQLSPGAYAVGTGRQVWIQSAKHLTISEAFSFERFGAESTRRAWESAYLRMERKP